MVQKASAKTPQNKVSAIQKDTSERHTSPPIYPIVGIGASAGGLEALEQFLRNVPEQQSKMDDSARVNNDMRNLLNSTEIVTVFLDNDLHIRRFTTGADKLFRLRTGDVGRPLSEIVSDLNYPELGEEVQEVLRTLAFSEKQITATDGRWYSVRIMPYRTLEDVIGGVVITFSNISAYKKSDAELREEIARLKGE